MILFADSSALVKLYSDEAGSKEVGGLIRRPGTTSGTPGTPGASATVVTVVSALARVEVPAALWRKHRMGELDAADVAVLVQDFEADWRGTVEEDPRFQAVAATTDVLERAARLAGVHRLRAYDAVQLASAVAAREAVPECTDLVAFDEDLVAAAMAEGFRRVPAR